MSERRSPFKQFNHLYLTRRGEILMGSADDGEADPYTPEMESTLRELNKVRLDGMRRIALAPASEQAAQLAKETDLLNAVPMQGRPRVLQPDGDPHPEGESTWTWPRTASAGYSIRFDNPAGGATPQDKQGYIWPEALSAPAGWDITCRVPPTAPTYGALQIDYTPQADRVSDLLAGAERGGVLYAKVRNYSGYSRFILRVSGFGAPPAPPAPAEDAEE